MDEDKSKNNDEYTATAMALARTICYVVAFLRFNINSYKMHDFRLPRQTHSSSDIFELFFVLARGKKG